jgi:hypothetical protein
MNAESGPEAAPDTATDTPRQETSPMPSDDGPDLDTSLDSTQITPVDGGSGDGYLEAPAE